VVVGHSYLYIGGGLLGQSPRLHPHPMAALHYDARLRSTRLLSSYYDQTDGFDQQDELGLP